VIIYGRNAVHEAIRAGRRPVREIVATAAAAREDWLPSAGVRIAADDELTRLAGTTSHQGVCADAGPYPYAGAAELLSESDPLIVVLDEIQDPQNLGAIVRTAEGVGASGVVIPERRSAEVTPAVCKASAGAVEWARVARVRNVADYLGEAKRAGCWCYGAAAGAGSVDYLAPDYGGGVVLVLGAEGKGLRPRVAGACDALVALPLRGKLGSLNVSAAAAALLYGILQKRVDSES
jgi:23S rRNA (guanosine2251-2'-O)-methyltransferase